MSTKILRQKINNVKVKVPDTSKYEDNRLPKHHDLFLTKYPNVMVISTKFSGKSVCVENIIFNCADQDTTIVAFCSTLHRDPIWKHIQETCKKKKIGFIGFDSLYDDKGKINILERFVKQLDKQALEQEIDPEEENEELKETIRYSGRHVENKDSFFNEGPQFRDEFEDSEEDYEDPEYNNLEDTYQYGEASHDAQMSKLIFNKLNQSSEKPVKKYITPEYIVIFDDLSGKQGTRDPWISKFLKKNRHYKAMTIVSTQWSRDLAPDSLGQSEYFILFQGMDPDMLEKIKHDTGLRIDLPTLVRIYKDATKDKYNFLYIDVKRAQFRKNFDEVYKIQSKENV